jgi:NADH-quinone oxidoreductase subunit F
MERLFSIEELQHLQKSLLEAKDPQRLRVRICMTGCRAFGAVEVRDALKKSIDEEGLSA